MKFVSFVMLLIETVMILALHSSNNFTLESFSSSFEVTFLSANMLFFAHCSDLFNLIDPNFSIFYSDFCSSLLSHMLDCL